MSFIKKVASAVGGAVQSVVSAPAQFVSDVVSAPKNLVSGNLGQAAQNLGNVATLGLGRPTAGIASIGTSLASGGLSYAAPVIGPSLLSLDHALQGYASGTLTRDQAIAGLQGAAPIGGLAAGVGGLGSFTQDDVSMVSGLIPSQTKIARDPAGGAVVLPEEVRKSQSFFSYVIIGAGIAALLLILKRKK